MLNVSVTDITKCGLKVSREQPIPVIFEEVRMDCGFRADLIVEGKLIIEVKPIEAMADVHKSIVLTYLKFANCKLGLLINFNVGLLKEGIKEL